VVFPKSHRAIHAMGRSIDTGQIDGTAARIGTV
jgi:hypothetical protein